ncbi:MAG TPA: aldo/keto reductase, partial [Polyangia bacterium]|nr:aldo/keto reductase [Polyangia bacterium]
DNVQALDVRLTAAHQAELDKLTTPTLNFPAPFLTMAGMIHAGGTTINGEKSEMIPEFGTTKPGDHY